MEIQDLTRNKIESLRKAFFNNKEVKEKEALADRYALEGRYFESYKLRKELHDLFIKCEQAYVDKCNNAEKEIKLIETNIPPQDMREITKRILSLFMCCDIIDALILDINEILHKHDKGFRFNQFDEFQELVKSSRDKLEFLHQNTEYRDSDVWGNVNDDMYRMMVNKANGILNKYKEGKL